MAALALAMASTLTSPTAREPMSNSALLGAA
jgi:hypothetical protein